MAEIIQFPVPQKRNKSSLEDLIDIKLGKVPEADRERLKFELLKTIDSYDDYFTEWRLEIPEGADLSLREQIHHIARREHGRKMRMLADIIQLKLQVLVDEYWGRSR